MATTALWKCTAELRKTREKYTWIPIWVGVLGACGKRQDNAS